MRVMQVSERFACRVTGQHRTTQRHRRASETLADRDAALRAWLRQWAKQHPRWGFRRAYHAARAEGWVVNHKRLQRLWREEGLRVPQRRRRKRVGASTAAEIEVAAAPNRVWAVDFQFDAGNINTTTTDPTPRSTTSRQPATPPTAHR
jgi:putative transposase